MSFTTEFGGTTDLLRGAASCRLAHISAGLGYIVMPRVKIVFRLNSPPSLPSQAHCATHEKNFEQGPCRVCFCVDYVEFVLVQVLPTHMILQIWLYSSFPGRNVASILMKAWKHIRRRAERVIPRFDQWGICGRDPNFPTEGRYIIVSCSDEDIRIGAERFAPSSPVVVWGKLDAWSFRPNPEKPGRYYIYVENLYSGEDPNKHVFVHEMPIWQDWAIHRHGDGCYSIEPDGTKFPSAGWTLTSKERESPVVVKGFEIPLPSQLWKFIPIPED